jgi:hypothetical protein
MESTSVSHPPGGRFAHRPKNSFPTSAVVVAVRLEQGGAFPR